MPDTTNTVVVNVMRMGGCTMDSKLIALLMLLSAAPAYSAGAGPDGAPNAPRLGFVTSVSGSLAFGTWPDAGGQVGTAAADQICSTRATIAGLPDPASFVAWLSDSSNDAWCRVHGLGGKRANNCGLPALPANAGPWQGTNGQPLLAALPAGLGDNGANYTPLRFNEFGLALPGGWEPVPTGTDSQGVASGTPCDDWTNPAAAGSTAGGSTGQTTIGWTASGTLPCSVPNRRLYCLQAGPGPALPAQRWGRMAFLTSATGSGDLSSWPQAGGAAGVAAGDNICRAEASAAGLSHAATFLAWLGSGTTGAATRFREDGPWRRPDGVRIADNIAGLTSGRLLAPINQTLDGTYLGGLLAWTGSMSNGGVTLNCDGWANADAQGVPGWISSSSSSWTFLGEGPCSEAMRLYCLSDSDELYVDGFDQPPLL